MCQSESEQLILGPNENSRTETINWAREKHFKIKLMIEPFSAAYKMVEDTVQKEFIPKDALLAQLDRETRKMNQPVAARVKWATVNTRKN